MCPSMKAVLLFLYNCSLETLLISLVWKASVLETIETGLTPFRKTAVCETLKKLLSKRNDFSCEMKNK